MASKKQTDEEKVKDLFFRIFQYAWKYEINIQLWAERTAIYINKNDVELYSYGSINHIEALRAVVLWLDRVNKKKDADRTP